MAKPISSFRALARLTVRHALEQHRASLDREPIDRHLARGDALGSLVGDAGEQRRHALVLGAQGCCLGDALGGRLVLVGDAVLGLSASKRIFELCDPVSRINRVLEQFPGH